MIWWLIKPWRVCLFVFIFTSHWLLGMLSFSQNGSCDFFSLGFATKNTPFYKEITFCLLKVVKGLFVTHKEQYFMKSFTLVRAFLTWACVERPFPFSVLFTFSWGCSDTKCVIMLQLAKTEVFSDIKCTIMWQLVKTKVS